MTAVSAFMPETANRVVLGRRSTSAPKITTPGEIGLEASFEALAQAQAGAALSAASPAMSPQQPRRIPQSQQHFQFRPERRAPGHRL